MKTMKIWRIAFAMLAAFSLASLASCSSDDDEEFLMDQLSGTWEQVYDEGVVAAASKKRDRAMTKRSKAVFIALPLLVLAGIAAFLSCSNREEFTGSRVKNPDAYLLDIQKMNGTDLHTLELRQGDVLQIQFETKKGSMYAQIKAPDGTSLYRGNGKDTTDFAVNIQESGVYTIVVEARHAKGALHIHLAEGNQ